MGIRAEQKEKRRQDILEKSLDLFVYKGYNGTTIRDIAKKVDMSVGLLFHYFESKQAILEELIKIAQLGVSSTVNLFLMPISPIECFDKIASTIFESFTVYPMTAKIFMLVNQVIMSEWAPESVKQLLHTPSRAIDKSVPIIIAGQQNGTIKQGDPKALSLAFWGSIQGVAETLVWYQDYPIPESSWIVDILRV